MHSFLVANRLLFASYDATLPWISEPYLSLSNGEWSLVYFFFYYLRTVYYLHKISNLARVRKITMRT